MGYAQRIFITKREQSSHTYRTQEVFTMVAIFVIATIVLFVLIDVLLQRRARATVPAAARIPVHDRFVIPRGYFLSPSHSWAELLFDGNARIGIDDFVQKLIGRVDAIEVAPIAASMKKGDTLFTIRQGGRTLAVPSPLSGKIVQVNPELKSSSAVIHEDPYVSGWVAIVEPNNLGSELKLMKIAEDAAQWLKKEIARFRNFIMESARQSELAPAGATLLDGGLPLTGVLQDADPHTWEKFQKEFLVV